MKKGTIAIDLDGTLARYDGWKGIDHIGEPLIGAKEFVNELVWMGYDIVIHTTRMNLAVQSSEYTAGELRLKIRTWLDKNGFDERVRIAKEGKPIAVLYIDDRAYSVKPNLVWMKEAASEVDKHIQARENQPKSEFDLDSLSEKTKSKIMDDLSGTGVYSKPYGGYCSICPTILFGDERKRMGFKTAEDFETVLINHFLPIVQAKKRKAELEDER